jgi:murein peptide amidase A
MGNVSKRELCLTAEKTPLIAHVFSPSATARNWILFLGGVHGDEVEGVWLMEEVLNRWTKKFPGQKCGAILIPQANPDGYAKGQRCNSRNVDLNRNLPTRDWTPEVKNPRYPPGPSAASEAETQALVSLISETKPRAILSAHSFSKFQVNVNGPSREWGKKLSSLCGYPITEDIGYPTPGCLGTYSGKELGIPTITLEIERGLSRERVLELHLPLVEASLSYWEEKV